VQYLGGKHRIAKPLSAFLLSRLAGRYFVEPFCGGINMTAAMEQAGPRLATDAHPALFHLYRAWRRGWRPSTFEITDDLYQALKARNDPTDPMTGFVGFGCSFGGKYFGGRARDPKSPRNYALNTFNSLSKKFARCSAVTFGLESYERLSPHRDCLVYCDPPYAQTTGYSLAFDSARFWEHVRGWSRAGIEVLVSEYTAPSDFEPVFEIGAFVSAGGKGMVSASVERVFRWRGWAPSYSPRLAA
jgi:DNA adenine methylase